MIQDKCRVERYRDTHVVKQKEIIEVEIMSILEYIIFVYFLSPFIYGPVEKR